MQAVAQTSEQAETRTLVISFEWVAYVLLVILALVLRVAELDTVPLTDAEAERALAAWRVVHPSASGDLIIPNSPILLWLQGLSFTTLGAAEMPSRLMTVLGGMVLILLPLLLRRWIGAGQAFLLALILTASASVLLTTRSADPMVWTMVFAVLGLISVWRYWESQQSSDALLAAGWFAAMIFLSGPGGPVLLVILLLAAFVAVWWSMLRAPDDLDLPGGEYLSGIVSRLRVVPWFQGLGLSVMVVVIGGTAFMLYPAGISAVGELLGDSVSGIGNGQPGAPAVFPLLVILFYEPFLVLFALVAVGVQIRHGGLSFVDRFLTSWIVIGGIVSLLYAGGQPGYALWIVVPLAMLASQAAAKLLTHYLPSMFWMDDVFDRDDAAAVEQIWWVKWVLAAVSFALVTMLLVHLQEVGRGLLTVPLGLPFDETLSLLMEQNYLTMRYSLIWLVITTIFIILGFFLSASIWGNILTVQGAGLGVLIFMLISSLAGGWNAAVSQADNPAEPWHVTSTAPDARTLRDTIFEVADRHSMGFPLLDITVVVDDSTITGRHIVAWLLRDFDNVQYVTSLQQARQDGIVLLPGSLDQPDLNGPYVGQRFAIRSTWDMQSLAPGDSLSWWVQRRSRVATMQPQHVILWLRQDIYDGVSAVGP